MATSTGVSPLRLMLLDDLPTVRATATNLSRAAAQLLSLPTAVEGTLASQQLHYFKFHAEVGQRVSFEVYARRIGSLLDPTLRLFDAVGREVTYSDDVPGLSEDAAIQRTFRAAGDYVLELGDNVYQGGGEYFYRLRIGDFPAAALPYPMAATRGGEFTCQFADASKSLIAPVHGKAPSDPTQATLFVPARQSNGNAQSFAPIRLSNHKQASEAEPNNSLKTATHVELGDDLNGRLDASDDVDHFVFHAPAEEVVQFTSFSRRLGSPADLVLRLLKTDGAQRAFSESQGAQETTLTATLPGAGDYVLEVRDLSHRGGPRFVYHVETVTQPAKPPKDHKKHSLPRPRIYLERSRRLGRDTRRRDGRNSGHGRPLELWRTNCRASRRPACGRQVPADLDRQRRGRRRTDAAINGGVAVRRDSFHPHRGLARAL